MYPELRQMDLQQLADAIGRIAFPQTDGPVDFTSTPSVLARGGSLIDDFRHVCYDMGTTEQGVEIPSSKGGQYCTLDPNISSNRNCTQNLSEIKKCNTAIDTYGAFNDAELKLLKNKYYQELENLSSI